VRGGTYCSYGNACRAVTFQIAEHSGNPGDAGTAKQFGEMILFVLVQNHSPVQINGLGVSRRRNIRETSVPSTQPYGSSGRPPWRVSAHVMNKKWGTANKGRYSDLGLGANNTSL
jgi:hypothetical protein